MIEGFACPFRIFNDPIKHQGIATAIAPGAFDAAIQAGGVRLIVDYDRTMPIASQEDGTLELRSTDQGLMFRTTPRHPMTTNLVRLGVLDACSWITLDYVSVTMRGDRTHRIIEQMNACDVTLLSHAWTPSYPGTWVKVC
jgi:HK97 family phage prohead protease